MLQSSWTEQRLQVQVFITTITTMITIITIAIENRGSETHKNIDSVLQSYGCPVILRLSCDNPGLTAST